jgi:hypothetical protein
MLMRYVVRNGDSEFGPFSVDEIKELLDAGGISMSSFVTPEGKRDFIPLSEMEQFYSQCGYTKTPSMFNNVTASDSLSQSNQNGYPSNSPSPPFNPMSISQESVSYTETESSAVTENDIRTYGNYHRTSVLSKSLEIFLDNILVWVLIELVSTIVSIIFLTSLIWPLFLGARGDFDVSSGYLIKTAILGLVSSYITMTSFIMLIDGAANLYDGMVLSISDMFIQAQKKLPIFVAVMLALSALLSLPSLLVHIFPKNLETFVKVISYAISGCILFKLFPLPISVVVEDWDLAETLRIGLAITNGHFLRFFGIVITIIIIQMLPFRGIFGFGLKAIYNINCIIMLTVLYKSMMDEALALGKI